MQHTLIAVFDNRADAEHAMDDLLASGFSRQDVKISKGDPTGITDSVTGRSASDTTADSGRQDEGFGASIRHFFSDIFGTDNSTHTQKYSDAVSRGHHVLTVTTESEPEVERAADIVEAHGPVDIDEKHAEWAGGAAMSGAESMRMSGAGGMQQSAGMSQQASMSQDLSDERNLYQQQSLNTAEPMGTTYQEPQGGKTGSSLQGSSLEGSAVQGTSLTGSQQRDTGRSSSLTGSGKSGSALTGSQQRDSGVARDTETSRAIPVVEEQLKIGKREVQRGGVRIYSRVVETPVNESIGLREEHVNVERRPVDQPISTTDATAFKEQSIEMRESAEEAVVQKSARVVEEVRVGKEVSERTEQIKDTVRRTEVEVEQLGARSGLGDDEYRRHWSSNFGSSGGRYEDYAPAYSYGSEMARNEKYRGRKWDEVESDLRSDWDTRYGKTGGGASAWEKMKAAVRHGWDRMTGDTDDDSRYRSHWDSNYSSLGGSYDDYAPAYRYGSDMAGSDKYRGRQWDDVESDLRSDYDTRHGASGGSAWEKTKDAVRHGWNKMTGDDDQDDYYRNHWSSNYASTGSSYDDYAPAYRYGTEMHRNSRFQNRRWDEVEPELRSDWDTRYGSSGGSTWEKMKAAVRHGWDRMTS